MVQEILANDDAHSDRFDASVASYDSFRERPRGPPEKPGRPVGWDCSTAERPCLLLLKFVAASGRLEGVQFTPRAGAKRVAELSPANGSTERGRVESPGTLAWAHVWGEPHVRVSPPPSEGGANWVFGGFGGSTSWRHLIDGNEDGRAVGGHVEIGEDSTLLRWCVRNAEATDWRPATVLPLAGRVPLPFERLWLVAERSDAVFGVAEDERLRAFAELEASGRLQAVNDTSIVIKATTVSADVYAAAKARVRAFARARRAMKQARDSGDDDLVSSARATYDGARKHIMVAYTTYVRGNEERRARRDLGILDERFERHQARLGLLYWGAGCGRSPLSRLAPDCLDVIADYITMADHDLAVAAARHATRKKWF